MNVKILCALAALFISLAPPHAHAEDGNPEALKAAQEDFQKQRFTSALNSLKEYLREYPRDQEAWVWLGASYYHTGQASLGLLTLSKSKPKGEMKTLRRYYIALCQDALGNTERARTLLEKQSRSKDYIAEDALFELTVINFESGEVEAAQKNLDDYKKKYPDGRFQKPMELIRSNLAQSGRMEVPGSRRSQYKATYFDTNPLSLVSMPHLWFYELGYNYRRGERSNPGYDGGVPIVNTGSAFEGYKLVSQAGFILGPLKGANTQSHAGYIYSQDWNSDSERMQTYFDEPSDLQYFPFRPDLMERRHRLFVETAATRGDWSFGGYGHWTYIRAGSDLFPAPERPEIRKSFDLGVETLFVPWVEWLYHPQNKLRLYLKFFKSLNREKDDFSFKSYNLSTSSESPFLSYTLQHETQFSLLSARLKEEVFYHKYLYNDYWESYANIGGSVQLQFRLWENFRLSAAAGYSLAEFSSEVIRANSCTDVGNEVDIFQESAGGVTCERLDKIVKFAAGASYVSNSQQSFAAIFRMDDRKNDKLIVYNESKYELLFVFTHAFPTIGGIERYAEPFMSLVDQRGVF